MRWEDTAELAGEMTSLKFFPTDMDGRIAIMKLLGAMAKNQDQVRWLVGRMLTLFDEWPGPRTLRIVFCAKFKPEDGIDIRGVCPAYPDGIPPEKPIPAESFPKRLQSVTADPQLNGSIIKLLSRPQNGMSKLLGAPEVERLPQVTPEQRKREKEFERVLANTITWPEDRAPEGIKKPIRQSAVVSANESPDPVDAPRPAGTYQPITRENFEKLLAEELAAKKKKEQEGGE
jgi:hypothetical protein